MSGSEPYFRMFCSCVAVAWVKEPLICAFPPLIAPRVSGASTTFPSSTIEVVSNQ